jgi:hypothetical protein
MQTRCRGARSNRQARMSCEKLIGGRTNPPSADLISQEAASFGGAEVSEEAEV